MSARSASEDEAFRVESMLSARLDQAVQGDRSRDQSADLPRVKLAVEAKAQSTAGLPPNHRRTAKRSAVQDHRRPARKICRALQLRAAGGQVEKMDRMTLAVCLQEGRHGDRDPRKSAAVFVRSRVLRVRSGARHHLAGGEGVGTKVLPESKRRPSALVESGHKRKHCPTRRLLCSKARDEQSDFP